MSRDNLDFGQAYSDIAGQRLQQIANAYERAECFCSANLIDVGDLLLR